MSVCEIVWMLHVPVPNDMALLKGFPLSGSFVLEIGGSKLFKEGENLHKLLSLGLLKLCFPWKLSSIIQYLIWISKKKYNTLATGSSSLLRSSPLVTWPSTYSPPFFIAFTKSIRAQADLGLCTSSRICGRQNLTWSLRGSSNNRYFLT